MFCVSELFDVLIPTFSAQDFKVIIYVYRNSLICCDTYEFSGLDIQMGHIPFDVTNYKIHELVPLNNGLIVRCTI